jgi:succinate dehydrogenase hydrophobic anchor subunit
MIVHRILFQNYFWSNLFQRIVSSVALSPLLYHTWMGLKAKRRRYLYAYFWDTT